MNVISTPRPSSYHAQFDLHSGGVNLVQITVTKLLADNPGIVLFKPSSAYSSPLPIAVDLNAAL